MSTLKTHLTALIVSVMLIGSAGTLFAYSNGRTGSTMKSGTSGCSCHTKNTAVTVTITGPDTVFISAVNTYTVTITGGPMAGGGVDIASSTGTLAAVSSGMTLSSGELTHSTVKAPFNSAVTFQFNYTAPASAGNQTLYATGISVNNTGGSGGDGWNFANNKTVVVVSAVPVELTSFTALAGKEEIKLNWSTATEKNNYGFKVERKDKNSDWMNIGFVKGNNNSTSTINYSFTDNNIKADAVYLYRLKQVDFDGSFAYSKEVEVNSSSPSGFALEQNYPNPFNPATTIKYRLNADSKVSIKVYDAIGKEIAELVNGFESSGTHAVNFNAASLSSGIYYYQIKTDNFTETRKMALLK